jgi:hypothetical protein
MQLFYMKSDKFKNDQNLSYLDTIEVMTDASSFLRDNFSNEISLYVADPFHFILRILDMKFLIKNGQIW